MTNEPVEHNIEDEFEVANFIVLRRINDVLMFLLRDVNPDAANHLASLHEQGIFVTPPPAWRPGEDIDDESTDDTDPGS